MGVNIVGNGCWCIMNDTLCHTLFKGILGKIEASCDMDLSSSVFSDKKCTLPQRVQIKEKIKFSKSSTVETKPLRGYL